MSSSNTAAETQPQPAEAGVALVIPGHDCGATIERCLEAVVPLLRARALTEIIFVDDHSTDDTAARVQRFAQVRLIQSPARGAGAARNAGWRAARSQLIWFVDADCVARPDALSRLQATLLQTGAGAVGGSYDNLWPERLVAQLIHEEMVERHEKMGELVTAFITANLLCRRELLERLEGFDESLRLGQDLDLAYRLVEAGSKLAFDAASKVGHFHETQLLRYCMKQARQGYWRMHIYARHPRRVSGDSYAGPADYVQPPLGVGVVASAALGLTARSLLLRRAALAAAGSGAGALLLLQLPRTARLVMRSRSPRLLAYAPMAMLRAGFRGAGMLAGALSLLEKRKRDGKML